MPRDVIFVAYGPIDDDMSETIQKVKNRIAKCRGKISYFTGVSSLGTMILHNIFPPDLPFISSKYEIHYASGRWEREDVMKDALKNKRKLTIVVLSPDHINTYFQVQYGQNVSIRGGEMIFCEDYFAEAWAGEFERI